MGGSKADGGQHGTGRELGGMHVGGSSRCEVSGGLGVGADLVVGKGGKAGDGAVRGGKEQKLAVPPGGLESNLRRARLT